MASFHPALMKKEAARRLSEDFASACNVTRLICGGQTSAVPSLAFMLVVCLCLHRLNIPEKSPRCCSRATLPQSATLEALGLVVTDAFLGTFYCRCVSGLACAKTFDVLDWRAGLDM